MSSLRFRAWDKKHRKYTKVLKVYFGSDGNNLGALVEDYETNYAFELQANQVELEQYTGLKDKNGEEIYEGDIVRSINTVHFEHNGYEHLGVVKFQDGLYGLYCQDGDDAIAAYYRLYSPYMRLRVIGNIHENSELLGGEE